MMEEIADIADCIIYSSYVKKDAKLYQDAKEDVYISLLTKIVTNIEEPIDVVFDE